MKWTPTLHQLPANMRFVWVTIERVGTAPRVREGWWDKDQWRIQSSAGYIPLAHDEKVTAFMDIPSCPPPYQPPAGPITDPLASFLNQCGETLTLEHLHRTVASAKESKNNARHKQ